MNSCKISEAPLARAGRAILGGGWPIGHSVAAVPQWQKRNSVADLPQWRGGNSELCAGRMAAMQMCLFDHGRVRLQRSAIIAPQSERPSGPSAGQCGKAQAPKAGKEQDDGDT